MLQYEYDTNETGDRVVLGRGTYGVVYAGRDLSNQVRIAIKEIPERDSRSVKVYPFLPFSLPRLHCQMAQLHMLCHRWGMLVMWVSKATVDGLDGPTIILWGSGLVNGQLK